jgi:metal-dependent amidase/aminoacylase/carboxypeptidase family protein
MKPTCLVLVCLGVVFGAVKTTAQLDVDKAAAFAWIDANTDAIDKVSLELWNEPELSFREFKTSRTLIRYLEANGFTVQ